MLLPDRTRSSPPLPARRLGRILAIGVACGVVVYGAGLLIGRVSIGSDMAATRARVRDDVRASFDAMTRALRDMALPLADGDELALAIQDDAVATGRLFDRADAALRAPTSLPRRLLTPDLAVTAYSAQGPPIAWGGRPSELPGDRLAGPEAWFFVPGELGPRLVYVRPIVDAGGSRRIGTAAAERALTVPQDVGPSLALTFRLPGAIAPVSVYPATMPPPVRPGDTVIAVSDPSGVPLLNAVLADEDIAFAVRQWNRASLSLAIAAFALCVLLLAGPLLDWRNAAADGPTYVTANLLIVAVVVAGRLLLRLASPADWTDGELFSASVYASPQLRPLLTSPFDFLLTAVAAAALVALALYAIEGWRQTRHRRRAVDTPPRLAAYVAAQLAAGAALAGLLVTYQGFLQDTLANTTLDLLQLSLHPWNVARVAMQVALVVCHATALGFGVLVLRTAGIGWRVSRRSWGTIAVGIACWIAPLALWQIAAGAARTDVLPLQVAAVAAITVAVWGTRLKARYRHGSQGFRLIVLTVALVIPAWAFYPSILQLAWRSKTQLIETRFAPQALNQRETIKAALQESLGQIDAFTELPGMVLPRTGPAAGPDTDRAFEVWRTTALATPMTSSLELFSDDGTLVSRFAFNLPEDLSAVHRQQEQSCDWDVYEEVSPFFAEERRVLRAGRAVCAGDGRRLGSIVVYTMLDYADLPFISSQSPYVAVLRRDEDSPAEGLSGRDVEYAVYGWSRLPLYASRETAWPLSDGAFARAADSREPFWTELTRRDEQYDVYVLNDRGGIYALGFPDVPPLGHLVNLAEVTALAGLTYLLSLALSVVFAAFSRRSTSARALFREVRASFYRKLFLAFVAAAVVPVVLLALVTRQYVVDQIRASIESEAVRTASSARRVVEDFVAPRAQAEGTGVDDNLMVWVSRLVGEDVNVFNGPQLLATSERNLFASGVLPTRTPADVYRDLTLRLQPSTVTDERIGGLEYMVVGMPMAPGGLRGVLTVPLTLRQQEVDAEIDTLDRRVLLAVLLFVLGGAGLGYSMAERIADPVNRLTRATRRIASGDLDARIAATSSDELRRLVDDFNSMANELQRQRAQLEQTNRLEAWAEMARQVAHEIKNPLTPIQLNAEHLRRVHADRGRPLSPVLEDCVDTILQQVRLLRQISSEFSSFASSPTAKIAPANVAELVREIVDPYRAGVSGRIDVDVDVSDGMPPARIDRTLIGRALTNLIENALHAMPRQGRLRVAARYDHAADAIRVVVSDTGSGMDPEALERAFEPYFSTKAAGTGLGLPIAKRNVELSGGTIAITSGRETGTTVELMLPAEVEMPVG